MSTAVATTERYEVFGMRMVNRDAIASAEIIKKAVAERSWFLLCVSVAMSLAKISQEFAAVAFVARNGSTSQATTGSAELSAAAQTPVPGASI